MVPIVDPGLTVAVRMSAELTSFNNPREVIAFLNLRSVDPNARVKTCISEVHYVLTLHNACRSVVHHDPYFESTYFGRGVLN